jgi:hypothetical protein
LIGRGAKAVGVWIGQMVGGLLIMAAVFAVPVGALLGLQALGDTLGGGDDSPTQSITTEGGSSGNALDHVYDDDIVDVYCSGAVSAAQYRGCVDHVSVHDIENIDSPAARSALEGVPESPDYPSPDYP